MIRVLHVVTYMGRGGLETMLMNYYRHIDREKVQFDFLVHREFEADYDKEIEELGGRIYRIGRLNPFNQKYLKQLDTFFETHKDEYRIVHSHLDCMAGIPLKYAKKHGIPVRIAHAHNSNQAKDKKYLLKILYKRNIPKMATNLFACGEEAGRWMFGGHEFEILNNAIDAKKYSYNRQIASKVRQELGIDEGDPIIGHVGRFAPQKNHSFIISIFSEVLQQLPNAKLLLIGEGELENEIRELVKKQGIEKSVIFTGIRDDVEQLLQAMDVFVFPSLHEGLPLAIMEAQAAGLPCLVSDKVPLECRKTTLVKQISLSEDVCIWVENVVEALVMERKNTYEEIKKSRFDICDESVKLEKYYVKREKNI